MNSFKDYSTYLPTVAATESNYKAVRSTYLPTYLPTKMKLNCLIIVIIVQFCAASKNDANLRRLKDWFKNVTDPTFECPPTSGKKSDPEVGANILAVVDCDDVGARPEFKFKVIKLVFWYFLGHSISLCLY